MYVHSRTASFFIAQTIVVQVSNSLQYSTKAVKSGTLFQYSSLAYITSFPIFKKKMIEFLMKRLWIGQAAQLVYHNI